MLAATIDTKAQLFKRGLLLMGNHFEISVVSDDEAWAEEMLFKCDLAEHRLLWEFARGRQFVCGCSWRILEFHPLFPRDLWYAASGCMGSNVADEVRTPK